MKRLYRKLQFSLIFFFIFVLASQALAEVDLTKLVKKIQPAVVTVITYDIDKKVLLQGSGFFVDKKGHLITNYHVLKAAYNAEVKTYDGKKYPIKSVLAENKTVDLIKVLVDIPEDSVQWVEVTKALPDIAERVLVVGSPMGLEQTVSEGIVSAVREIGNVGKIFQISAPISPGSSGSPVVNMKGKVIGVATFYLMKGQNLNFAVPGKYVLDLKREKTGKTISEWTGRVRIEKLKEAHELWIKGCHLYFRGEYKKAVPFLKKAIEKDTDSVSWYWLGRCYNNLSKHKDAIEAFKQAIRIDPDDAAAHFYLGSSYVELGLSKEAIEAFKQAIRIDPDDADYHRALGIVYGFHLNRHKDAIEAFKQAIRIDPDDAAAHTCLGFMYSSVGNRGAALEEYKIVKSLDKNLGDDLFDFIYR